MADRQRCAHQLCRTIPSEWWTRGIRIHWAITGQSMWSTCWQCCRV